MTQTSRSADDPEQLAYTLMSLLNAATWDDAQRIVEQHPELLREAAEAMLGVMEAAQSAEAVRVLRQHRELLRHCRELGISRAFAEKLLTAESLAEAARQGVTPEELLAQLRAAEQKAPGLRDIG